MEEEAGETGAGGGLEGAMVVELNGFFEDVFNPDPDAISFSIKPPATLLRRGAKNAAISGKKRLYESDFLANVHCEISKAHLYLAAHCYICQYVSA